MARKAKTKAAKLREFKETSRHSLSPITHSYRVQFRRDMNKLGTKFADTIEAHKAAHDAAPTEHSKQQLAYFKTVRSVLRFLANLNEQRRGYGPTK